MHGRAGGAEIDPLAPGLHVVARLLAVEHELPRRLGDGVLDQGARKGQPPLVVVFGAGRRAGLDAGGDRVGEADVRQHLQHRADGSSGCPRP